MAKAIALNHHQRWDGSGYPGLAGADGTTTPANSKDYRDYENLRPLKGEEIPVEALIVALSDKYDALRSPRSYKPGLSHEKTCELLARDDRTGSIGQNVFGNEIFELFLAIKDEFDAIYVKMQG